MDIYFGLQSITCTVPAALKYHKMLDVSLKFSQNRPKKILFSSGLKKGQEKAIWPNYFISRKLFQKRPNGKPEFVITEFDNK